MAAVGGLFFKMEAHPDSSLLHQHVLKKLPERTLWVDHRRGLGFVSALTLPCIWHGLGIAASARWLPVLVRYAC